LLAVGWLATVVMVIMVAAMFVTSFLGD